MDRSALATSNSISPLFLQAVVRPRGVTRKRSLVTAVMLTSLIDAFTVLIFFCLMNPLIANDNVQLTKGMKLPEASSGEELADGPVVRMQDGQYYINNQMISKDGLRAALSVYAPKTDEEKAKIALVLQADKNDEFSGFNHVILAAAQNGIQKFQFLVLPAKE